MNIRNITFISALFLLPSLSMAATINQFHVLTDNSYYAGSTLTGLLQVIIDDSNYTVTIDYSNVLLDGSSFLRPLDTLVTDIDGINSGTLISGWDGEPNYTNYGNATLSPFPFICVECSYEMTLNLTANPLILSYHEYNPWGTGELYFEVFVSQVPLPATVWLFISGLIGLLGFGNRNRKHT